MCQQAFLLEHLLTAVGFSELRVNPLIVFCMAKDQLYYSGQWFPERSEEGAKCFQEKTDRASFEYSVYLLAFQVEST